LRLRSLLQGQKRQVEMSTLTRVISNESFRRATCETPSNTVMWIGVGATKKFPIPAYVYVHCVYGRRGKNFGNRPSSSPQNFPVPCILFTEGREAILDLPTSIQTKEQQQQQQQHKPLRGLSSSTCLSVMSTSGCLSLNFSFRSALRSASFAY
jgi:hypothetical protein